MGSLELLSYFWSLNTILVVQIENFDVGGLSHPPNFEWFLGPNDPFCNFAYFPTIRYVQRDLWQNNFFYDTLPFEDKPKSLLMYVQASGSRD